MRNTRRLSAFTLIEILVCIAILSLCLFPLYMTATQANRSSMDAYYESLAGSLAQEPIEVFRALGYRGLTDYARHPLPDFPLGWQDLSSSDWQRIPAESGVFRRFIEVAPYSAGGDDPAAIRVRVTVAPKGASWLSRDQVIAEAVIIQDQP